MLSRDADADADAYADAAMRTPECGLWYKVQGRQKYEAKKVFRCQREKGGRRKTGRQLNELAQKWTKMPGVFGKELLAG